MKLLYFIDERIKLDIYDSHDEGVVRTDSHQAQCSTEGSTETAHEYQDELSEYENQNEDMPEYEDQNENEFEYEDQDDNDSEYENQDETESEYEYQDESEDQDDLEYDYSEDQQVDDENVVECDNEVCFKEN